MRTTLKVRRSEEGDGGWVPKSKASPEDEAGCKTCGNGRAKGTLKGGRTVCHENGAF